MKEDYPATDDNAYDDGVTACKRGDPISSNPFQRYSHSWEQWRLGWLRTMVVIGDRAKRRK